MPESSNSGTLDCNRLHWWVLTNLHFHKKDSVEIQRPIRADKFFDSTGFVILHSFQIYTDKKGSTLFYINYDFVTIRMPCNLDKRNPALSYI